MSILFRSWKESLRFLTPSLLSNSLKEAWRYSLRSFKDMLRILKWVILADIVIFLLFGKKFVLAIEQLAANPSPSMPMSVAFLSMAVIIVTFLLQGAFLIFLRKRNVLLPLRDYFKIYFLRYAQLALFFSFAFVVFFSFIMSLGVTKIPGGHWVIAFALRFLELLILFFWLDSQFSFRDLLMACERGLNFFMYNIAFFVVILALLLLGFIGITRLLTYIPDSLFFIRKGGVIGDALAGLGVVALRYIRFFLEFLWVAFLFVFYEKRKGAIYNKSLFNNNNNE